MKKLILTALVFCVALGGTAAFASGEAEVALPDFPVTLNGEVYDSLGSEYPLLVSEGVTYLPLTYKLNRFMGIKIVALTSKYNKDELFVGAGERSELLEVYPAERDNIALSYRADVPLWQVAINHLQQSLRTENSQAEYPLLRFRDVIYLPMTWEIAHDELGWEYSFDSEDGLVLDSRAAVRPIIPDNDIITMLYGSMHNYIRHDYVYNFDSYAGYPPTTYGAQFEFVWKTRSREERRFSLKDDLVQNGITDVYFDAQPPELNGSVLTLYTTRNQILEIDMEKGELASVRQGG